MVDARGNMIEDDGLRFQLPTDNPVVVRRLYRIAFALFAIFAAIMLVSSVGCASGPAATTGPAHEANATTASFDEEITVEEIEILFGSLETTWTRMDARSIEGTTTLRGGAAANLSENEILVEIERKVGTLSHGQQVTALKRLVRILLGRKAKLQHADTEFLTNGDDRSDENFVEYGAEMNLRAVSVDRSIERYRSWIRRVGG